MAGGGHFTIAQRQELVPLESATLSAPSEMMEAARLQREEGKAKSAVSKTWGSATFSTNKEGAN